MKRFFLRLAVFVLAVVGASTAFATEQTGVIKGVVAGPDGTPIEGITIVVEGANLMGQRTLTTDAKGSFRFIALPPGPYDVVATGKGFLGQVKKTTVFIGRSQNLDFGLTVPEAEGQEIIVRDQRPTIDTEQTSVGEVIDQDLLQNLPTSRSYQGVAGMVPGVVGGGNPNIKGGGSADNSWLIDGVNTSDPVTNTFSSNFNFDAIQQLEVLTNGFGGENQTMGGVINIVTKSGGNEFEGGISTYLEDDQFFEWVPGNAKRAHNCAEYEAGYTLTGNDLEDEEHCVDLIEASERGQEAKFYDANVYLGGPIIKDKLWFFTSYQFDQSILSNNGVLLPRVYTGHYGLAKVTWQATPAHKMTGQFQTDPTTINRVVQSRFTPAEAEAQQVQGGFFAQAKHEWFARSDLLIETQVFQKTSNIDVGPSPDDNGDIDLETPGTFGFAGAFDSGNYPSFSFNRRARTTFRTKAIYYRDNLMGSHEFEAGLDATRLTEDYAFGLTGNVRYNVICEPAFECEGAGAGTPINYYRIELSGPIRQQTTANVFGFWLQDKWKPLGNLVLQPILRFDRGAYQNDTGDTVINYFALSPRFHFSWDPFADQKSRVFGGYGRSIDPGKLSLSDFMNAHSFGQKLFLATGPGEYFEGANELYLSDNGESTTVRAPNLTYPRTDEVFLGLERDVFRGFAVGLTYTGRWSRHLYEDDEANLMWNSMGNNIIGNRANIEDTRYRIRTPGSAVRFYQGLDVIVRKRFSENFNVLGSYTLSRTSGTSSGSYTAALDNAEQVKYDFGVMPWDRTHQLKLQGSYKFAMGLTLGTSINARSGLPFDRLVWNDFFFGNTNRTSDRGSFGRTPAAYTADMRVMYDYKLPSRYGSVGASLDIFNLTLNRQVTSYQTGYLNVYGEDCDKQADCSDLLRPLGRIAPLSGRLGIFYKF